MLEARLASIDAPARIRTRCSRRTALRLQIAQVREQHLGDLEGAISALEVALGEVGADPMVDRAARRRLPARRLPRGPDRAVPAGGDGEPRTRRSARTGSCGWATPTSRIEQPREAAEAYRRALTERPGDRAIEASLRELYRALGPSEPLVELLEAELRHLAGTAEIPVRLELVERLRAIAARTRAAPRERVLQLAPRHRAALERARSRSPRRSARARGALDVARGAAPRGAVGARGARSGSCARRALLAGPLARPDAAIDSYRARARADPSGGRAPSCAASSARCSSANSAGANGSTAWRAGCASARRRARASSSSAPRCVAWERISPEAALPWLERLRRERPGDPERARAASRSRIASSATSRRCCAPSKPRPRPRPGAARAALPPRARGAAARGGRARARAVRARRRGPGARGAARCANRSSASSGSHAQRARDARSAARARPDPTSALHRELAALYAGELRDAGGGGPALAGRAGGWSRRGSPARDRDPALARGRGARERPDRRLGAPRRGASSPRSIRRRSSTIAGASCAASSRSPTTRSWRGPTRRSRICARCSMRATSQLLGRETRDRLERACLRLLRAGRQLGGARAAARAPARAQRRTARRMARAGAAARGDAAAHVRGARRLSHARSSASRATSRRCAACAGPPSGSAAGPTSRTRSSTSSSARASATRPTAARCCARWATSTGTGLPSTTRASRCYAAALEANAADFAALRALERLLEAMEDWRGALDLYESEVEVLGSTRTRGGVARSGCTSRRWRAIAPAMPSARARRCARAGEIEPLDDAAARRARRAARGGRGSRRVRRRLAAWCDAPDAGAGPRITCGSRSRSRSSAAPTRPRQRGSSARSRPTPGARGSLGRGGAAARRERRSRSAARARCAAPPSRSATRAPPRRGCAMRRRARADAEPRRALEMLRSARRALARATAPRRPRARGSRRSSARTTRPSSRRARRSRSAPRLARPPRARGGGAHRRRGGAPARARWRWRRASTPRRCARARRCGRARRVRRDLVALGDHPAARRALERRLARGDDYPERAAHRALLGRCLELAGEPEEALAHYEAALRCDPLAPRPRSKAMRARARVARPHRAGRRGDRALGARRAHAARSARARLLRAAQWELRRGGPPTSAERHLRAAVAADPGLTPAWIALAELQIDGGPARRRDRGDRPRRPRTSRDPTAFAALAHLQGRVLRAEGRARATQRCVRDRRRVRSALRRRRAGPGAPAARLRRLARGGRRARPRSPSGTRAATMRRSPTSTSSSAACARGRSRISPARC